MADFSTAFKKVSIAEGGYVNDKDDAGGETYRGIARKSNPKWIGWKVIDNIKSNNPNGFKSVINNADTHAKLNQYVLALYKSNYWDVLFLDPFKSQAVAEQLFDMCVNAGKTTAVRLAQRIVKEAPTGVWTSSLHNKLVEIV